MLKKAVLLALAAGSTISLASPAAAKPDFCFACIKEFGTGQTNCVIVDCPGGGGGTAAVPQGQQR